MKELRQIYHLKSLGYGGSLGAGISALIYVMWPDIMPAAQSIESIVMIGGLLSFGFHRFIYKAISPFSSFTMYYCRLGQLIALNKSGVLTNKKCKELIEKLTGQYFTPP